MTHWVKALAAKPEDTRNSAPGTHKVERELILQVFSALHIKAAGQVCPSCTQHVKLKIKTITTYFSLKLIKK